MTSSISYSSKAKGRAERALRCSPFQLQLFLTMRQHSIALRAIATLEGTRNGYTPHPISEMAAENYLSWLIQVGVLRREVDGQGITDSFRLTPLGHELLQQWETAKHLPHPSWRDRLLNFLDRRLSLPFWLRV
jgi:hypothetical protein